METTTRALDLWNEIVDDPRFRDFPGTVETNAQGQIIMSPHKLRHSFVQSRIGRLLQSLADQCGLRGSALSGVGVITFDGVKWADAAWLSAEREASFPDDPSACPVAPEICVEVRSASNTDAEMAHKRRLYVEAGAEEVWVVDESGAVTF